jgi:high-affinity iron transporter
MVQRILESVWVTDNTGSNLFSIPVFFVLLRETVEVVIIIAITFSYLSDNKLTEFKKWAIAGVVAGTLLDLVIGMILIAIFATIKSNAFDSASDSENVFKGTLMLFSSIVVTVFGLGMSKMFNNINATVGRKITTISKSLTGAAGARTEAIARGSDEIMRDPVTGELIDPNSPEAIAAAKNARSKIAWGVLSVTFFAVVREGLECILFLGGLTSSYPPQSMPIPAIMGVVTGCFVGMFFYRGGRQMGIRFFAIASMAMLFLVAAGLIARSFTEFVELGMVGGPVVYDASECCGTDTPFWGFLRIIFGYNATPTLIEFLIYFSYWIVLALAGELMGVWASFKTPLAVPIKDDDAYEKNSSAITGVDSAVIRC